MQHTKRREAHLNDFMLTYFNYKFNKKNKVLSKETTVCKDLEYSSYADEDGSYMVSYCKHSPILDTHTLYKKPKED